MTKSLVLDPNVVRQTGTLHFEDIPVNTYKKTVSDEKGNYTDEEFIRIYRDMFVNLRDYTVLESAYRAAKEIDDDTERGDALLFLVDSIDNM